MPCRTTCGPKSSVTVWCRGQKPTYCDTYQEAELMIYGSPHLERRCVVERGCVPQVVFGAVRRMASRGMPGYAVSCKGDGNRKPKVFLTWAEALYYTKMMGGKCSVRQASAHDLSGMRRKRGKRARKSLGCGCGG